MAKKALFISKIPLPLTSISLGRFVTDLQNPQWNFFDPHEKLPTKPSPVSDHSDILDVSRLIEKSFGTKLELVLTTFASTFFGVDTSQARQLATCRMTKYFLLNGSDWFDMLCEEEIVQQWLERETIRRRTIYLVTEYYTMVQPSSNQDAKLATSVGTSVQGPVLSAVGVPVPTPLDPSISMKVGGSHRKHETYHVPDEKVFAVTYQKVTLSNVKEGQPKYKVSDKRTWVPLCSVRAAGAESYSILADLEEASSIPGCEQLETDEEILLFNPE